MKIFAKNFLLRYDLENEVRNKFGLTADPKPEHTIEGTREELKRLFLSDRTVFWGIRCIITDSPTLPKKVSKVNRGERFKSGLNLE